MNKLGAVLWDVDGTIADTETYGHRVAFNRSFKDYKIPWHWAKDEYIGLLSISGGIRRVKYYSKLIGFGINEDLLKKIIKSKQSHFRDIVMSGSLTLRPGVRRLSEEISSLGIKQFIVTTSRRESAKTLVNKLFEDSFSNFSQFICFEDVQNHKPFPDAYSLAIKLSNQSPQKCLAIEDSLIGIKSCKTAKVKCILTLSPWLKQPTEEMSIATAAFDHLGDFSDENYQFFGSKCPTSFIDTNYLQSL